MIQRDIGHDSFITPLEVLDRDVGHVLFEEGSNLLAIRQYVRADARTRNCLNYAFLAVRTTA
jgi:predicted RNA-binding protein YlqC (UPF0109 family)